MILPGDDGGFEVKDAVVHVAHEVVAEGGTAVAECDAVHPADDNTSSLYVIIDKKIVE